VNKSIILFDGVCNLCSFWVNIILKNDRKGIFLFAPLQSIAGQIYINKFDLQQTILDTIIVIDGERTYTKSKAVLEIAKKLPLPYKLACILEILPPNFRNMLYSVIARNRYKIFGKRDTCRVPTPEEKSRFLD
jgi:predicted DCC family thiol-disulfide oxidoreductase YuxK